MIYANEIDPVACAVLRECGLVDHVDERSIKDVQSGDVGPFRRAHFFSGAGLWEVAARLAGWPDDRLLWTGSCPCQPLSVAGQRKGHVDERHLWPAFYRLIAECKPATIVGEQVAGKDGREWFSGVRADLESLGYACGAADLPACSVGAPHKRNRLWWVAILADSAVQRRGEEGRLRQGKISESGGGYGVDSGPMADADMQREGQSGLGKKDQRPTPDWVVRSNSYDPMADAECGTRNWLHERVKPRHLAPDIGERLAGEVSRPSPGASFWHDAVWLNCADGKARRTKPGLRLLVDGLVGRIDLWRLAGNSIVPQVAAQVLGALLEIQAEMSA